MKKIIQTQKAPMPFGPYSQAVLYGNLLFISGQIAINPISQKLETENLAIETTMVMENLKAILLEAGFSFEDIIKTSIFISDMNKFNEINDIYATYFDAKSAPARETVEVANLPKFVNVEISAIAIKS